MEITKEDKILLAGVEDKFNRCSAWYCLTHTSFLDLRQRSLAEKLCRELMSENGDVRCLFFGGYEDAERTVALFLSEHAEPEEYPLSVIRIKAKTAGRKLTHRDYLGSLTGLGLKREMLGDILTTDEGADVIILEEVRDFILMNYNKAGRAPLTVEGIPLSDLCVPEQKTVMVKDTVASLRLDNVVASAFRLSRSKAADAIRNGFVFVNSIQLEKPDVQVKEGDKLVLRGKGKAYLRRIGNKTRKDRINISVEKYL